MLGQERLRLLVFLRLEETIAQVERVDERVSGRRAVVCLRPPEEAAPNLQRLVVPAEFFQDFGDVRLGDEYHGPVIRIMKRRDLRSSQEGLVDGQRLLVGQAVPEALNAWKVFNSALNVPLARSR